MLTYHSCRLLCSLVGILLALWPWFVFGRITKTHQDSSTFWEIHLTWGWIFLLFPFFLLLLIPFFFLAQRWRGPHRMLHCHRCHDREDQAREDGGRVRPCNANALPEELHGPDGGPVHLHSWRAAGGCDLRQHWSPREEPLLLHPEADADRARGECDRHGAGVQGERCEEVKTRFTGHDKG